MEVLYRVCAGLDVHQESVPTCLRQPAPEGQRTSEVRTLGTPTRELLRMAE